MIENVKLSNKNVIISGAAGGLGQVVVQVFAEQGYKVFAIDIDKPGLERFKGIGNVFTKSLDVTDSEQLSSFIKEAGPELEGLDTLVCLAGIYHTYPLTEADPEDFKRIISVNLLGVSTLVNSFLVPLIRKKGRVVVVSSESYKIQALFQPYMISKAALEAYCRVARQELALKNVKLIVIRPGAISTPLLNWMNQKDPAGKYPVFDKEFLRSRELSIKLVGKIATPARVAGKILKASTASNPQRVYHINNNPFLTLVTLIPSGILDRLIVSKFKLKD